MPRPPTRLADVVFSGPVEDWASNLPEWTRRVVDQVNSLPAFSIFSTQDGPNESGETANQSTLGFEVGSSATTRLWVAGSDSSTDWRAII